MSSSPPVPKKRRHLVWLVGCAGAAALSLVCLGGIAALYNRTRDVRPAAFDPNNLDRTVQWTLAASHRATELQHNEADLEEYVGELTAECQSLVGKAVRWSVPVAAVTGEQVELKVQWCDGPPNASGQVTTPTLTLQRAGAPIPVGAIASLPLDVGEEIAGGRADRLQPGSTVTITATISDVSLRPYETTDGKRAIETTIVLDDLHAE